MHRVGGQNGYNGGGAGKGTGTLAGGNGGGASDIRRGACGLADRIAVAGGGGGAGGSNGVAGVIPGGGGNAGAAGARSANGADPGQGATATNVGAGGQNWVGSQSGPGVSGLLGAGGAAGGGKYGGGGGGGGLYGGGGAAGSDDIRTVNGPTIVTSTGPAGSGGGGGSSLAPTGGTSTVASVGGNGAVTITYQDSTDPTATITSPRAVPVVKKNGTLLAAYSCADAERLSECIGKAGQTPVANGGALPTDTEGMSSLDVTAVDAAGHFGFTSAAYEVDGTPPTTTDDVPSTPHMGPVTVHLNATDKRAGVDTTYYEIGTSPATPTTNSPTYSQFSPPVLRSGERIKYFSVDRVGNAEAVKTSSAVTYARPTVSVKLAIVPATDVARADLEIGGTVINAAAADGDSASVQLDYGSATSVFARLVGEDPNGAYSTTTDCAGNLSAGAPLQIATLTGDLSCTVTVRRLVKLTVTNRVLPAGKARFNLLLTDDTLGRLVGDGFSTTKVLGAFPTDRLSVQVEDRSTDRFVTTIDCGPLGTSVGLPLSFTKLTADAACTVTNRYRPLITLRAVSDLDPAVGAVDLKVAGETVKPAAKAGDEGSLRVSYADTPTVTAVPVDRTAAADFDVRVDCGDAGTSATPSLTLTAATDDVTCTVRAARKPVPTPTLTPTPAPTTTPTPTPASTPTPAPAPTRRPHRRPSPRPSPSQLRRPWNSQPRARWSP